MKVLDVIRVHEVLALKGAELEPARTEDVRPVYTAQRFHVFDRPSDMSIADKYAWYLPANFNQGGFNLVHVEREKKMLHFTFFQVTRSARHTRKYRFMTEFSTRSWASPRTRGLGRP